MTGVQTCALPICQTLEEAEPGSVLSFESLLGAIKEQDQVGGDLVWRGARERH